MSISSLLYSRLKKIVRLLASRKISVGYLKHLFIRKKLYAVLFILIREKRKRNKREFKSNL